MKVLLTGGAGFIGANLAHYWTSHHPGEELVVFDALTYAGHRESIRPLEGQPGFRFIHGDIRDREAVGKALSGVDLVLHLAAESHNDRAIRDPMLFLQTNVLGTGALLEECRRQDIPRFHHVSTDEVFGMLPLDTAERFTEESPYRPRGPYPASKASADHLVRAWGETYGFRYTISNSGNNLGPYQFPEKLIPLSILRLLRGQTVQLYGDGRHVRDWIYVVDHCEAIDLIAHRGTLGSTYLVSAENELSNRAVAERLLRLFGRDDHSLEFIADRPGHDRRYALDSRRLREELGWHPRHDFDTALSMTVDWYRTHASWWEPLLAGHGVGT
ncbi:MAG: dTDP-glucose 4,6-dehydratase [Thermoplasmata archaeon]|nr:dTDP-glucose 4,6-dehydratase [Thermoplasmata archaeon]